MSKMIQTLGVLGLLFVASNAQAQNAISQSANSTPVLSCFVDTPAYDQFTEGYCASMSYSGPRTTTAVFQVFGVDDSGRYSFQWHNCTSSNSQCFRNIMAYRPIEVSVTVTDNHTGVQTFLTAQAEYELGY